MSRHPLGAPVVTDGRSARLISVNGIARRMLVAVDVIDWQRSIAAQKERNMARARARRGNTTQVALLHARLYTPTWDMLGLPERRKPPPSPPRESLMVKKRQTLKQAQRNHMKAVLAWISRQRFSSLLEP